MSAITVPAELSTARLQLRRWRAEDAKLLLPVLEANVAHLHWIPAHVAAPLPEVELAARLAGFAADFEAGRSWRFGIFPRDQVGPVGEMSMFPRDGASRVPAEMADRVEIGYWLARSVTGRGYATEAAGSLLALAAQLPGISHVEIRCDPENAPSQAVAARLGFQLAGTFDTGATATATDDGTMLWVRTLERL